MINTSQIIIILWQDFSKDTQFSLISANCSETFLLVILFIYISNVILFYFPLCNLHILQSHPPTSMCLLPHSPTHSYLTAIVLPCVAALSLHKGKYLLACFQCLWREENSASHLLGVYIYACELKYGWRILKLGPLEKL